MKKLFNEALLRADRVIDELPAQIKEYAIQHSDIQPIFDSLTSYFNTENWFINSSIEDWLTITFVICRVFNINVNREFDFKKKDTSFHGTIIEINEYYKGKVVKDIMKVEYVCMYPAIIYSWLIKNKIKSELFDFTKVFTMVFDMYKSTNKCDITPLVRGWINWCYGILTSYNLIENNPISLIRLIQKDIYENFKGHIVYFDCDAIWFVNFNEIVGRFVNYNSELQKKYRYLIFTIQEIGHFYITAKKKYIEMSGEVKVKGLKKI